ARQFLHCGDVGHGSDSTRAGRVAPGPKVNTYRTITAGHGACAATAWATEPNSIERKPPRPREPTTTRSAVSARSSSDWAAPPSTSIGTTVAPSVAPTASTACWSRSSASAELSDPAAPLL